MFFNQMLIGLADKGLNFMAAGIYVGLNAYLMAASIKGNLKYGVRFAFIFPIHPMVVDET